ncbi:nitrile hydratase subunit alpha [soil metagenome]
MSGQHHWTPPDPLTARARAIETLMYEKGLLTPEAVDGLVRAYEQDIGPLNGARVVAKAWSDPTYKAWLLEDGTAAIADLGFYGADGDHIHVVENTDEVHNLVVCTLCSCYPWPVLGLPPTWYKHPSYRSRAVRDPRSVMAEFGLEISPDVEVRVWDSSSDLRYLVLPQRPAGTEALTEDELVGIVTRDSMIGVGVPRRSGADG